MKYSSKLDIISLTFCTFAQRDIYHPKKGHGMSHRPEISIIVAVYNAEKTLKRCVDSLLAQTFAHFEVLLIDDGSTDNSGALCDHYAARDARCRVMHQSNGGVASVRQKGIEEASGRYSIHVDADDWADPTMLANLYTEAERGNADIVLWMEYLPDASSMPFWRTEATPPLL